jgi:hypothetical protein
VHGNPEVVAFHERTLRACPADMGARTDSADAFSRRRTDEFRVAGRSELCRRRREPL